MYGRAVPGAKPKKRSSSVATLSGPDDRIVISLPGTSSLDFSAKYPGIAALTVRFTRAAVNFRIARTTVSGESHKGPAFGSSSWLWLANLLSTRVICRIYSDSSSGESAESTPTWLKLFSSFPSVLNRLSPVRQRMGLLSERTRTRLPQAGCGWRKVGTPLIGPGSAYTTSVEQCHICPNEPRISSRTGSNAVCAVSLGTDRFTGLLRPQDAIPKGLRRSQGSRETDWRLLSHPATDGAS